MNKNKLVKIKGNYLNLSKVSFISSINDSSNYKFFRLFLEDGNKISFYYKSGNSRVVWSHGATTDIEVANFSELNSIRDRITKEYCKLNSIDKIDYLDEL